MNRRRHQSAWSKIINQLRDYAVPIVGVLLVLVIIYNAFSWWEPSSATTDTETSTESTLSATNKMNLDFDAENTTWFVEYSGGSKDKLAEKKELYPWEKLIVEQGGVTLKSADNILMKLNKNGELKYDSNGDYLLSSSDLFVKVDDALNVNLRFLNVSFPSGAVVSLNQNDIASTINVLSGTAQVSSFAGKKAELKSWERLSITSVETTKEDFDLSIQIEEIWNYFFSETWAQNNDLISYLEKEELQEDVWTEGTEGETSSTKEKHISIIWLEDNKTYGQATLDISWKLIDEGVTKVTFNNQAATINLVAKSYELKNFSIPLRENDIVYKVYNTAGNVLERWVYTVYYQQWVETSTSATSDTTDFPVTDSNPQFAFTSPSPNPYTSNEDFITIRGSATVWAAASVMVNGLKLKSFNGTSWRYHAATRFNTLKNGVNLYKVNYYDASWAVLHTNTFTIIRKAPVVIPEKTETSTVPAETSAASTSTDNSGADSIANRIPLD